MHSESIVAIPQGVGLIPYTLPGTEELAQATATSLVDHCMVIWEKHGCLAAGVDVLDAFDVIDVVAKVARIFFYCAAGGFTPQGLTQPQLEELKRKFVAKG
jgi:rhamnulose-1-phosphate aldolase